MGIIEPQQQFGRACRKCRFGYPEPALNKQDNFSYGRKKRVPHQVGESIDFIDEIRHYSALQRALVSAFLRSSPDVKDWEWLLDAPTRGHVNLDEELWRFAKHGAGLRFVKDPDEWVVDADRKMTEYPSAFDANRIAQFISSKYGIYIDTSWVRIELDRLAGIGKVSRINALNLYLIGS